MGDGKKTLFGIDSEPVVWGGTFYLPTDYRWLDEMSQSEPMSAKPVCECGTSKTLGEANDDPQFHSTWCPVYKKAGVP